MRNMKFIYVVLVAILACFSAIPPSTNINMGAIIVSGPMMHQEGERLESHLLRKSFEVHRLEVRPQNDYNFFDVSDWKQFRALENLASYDRLMFLITAHGNSTHAAHIAWDSWLILLQYLEGKTKELFVHISTCMSGNIVDEWERKLDSTKLKVFITTSCRNVSTSVSWPRSQFENLFSGYWQSIETTSAADGEHFDHVNQQKVLDFEKLDCNATIENLMSATHHTECTHTRCYKNHVHVGKHIEARDWRIFPFLLTYKHASLMVKTVRTECSEPLSRIQYNTVPTETTILQMNAKEQEFFEKSMVERSTFFDHPSNWQICTTEFHMTNWMLPVLKYEGSGMMENSWFIVPEHDDELSWKKDQSELKLKEYPQYGSLKSRYDKTITLGRYENPNTMIKIDEKNSDQRRPNNFPPNHPPNEPSYDNSEESNQTTIIIIIAVVCIIVLLIVIGCCLCSKKESKSGSKKKTYHHYPNTNEPIIICGHNPPNYVNLEN